MRDDPEMFGARGRTAELEHGRRTMRLVIAALLGVSVAITVAGAGETGATDALVGAGRVLGTTMLCVALYRGADWSRRLFIALLAIAMPLMLTVAAITVIGGRVDRAVILGVALTIYGWVGWTLWRSAPLRSFMAAQLAGAARR